MSPLYNVTDLSPRQALASSTELTMSLNIYQADVLTALCYPYKMVGYYTTLKNIMLFTNVRLDVI